MSFNLVVDHDPAIVCPYDANHKIARSRIQKHIVKCEKNFPPNYKQQCPYDATHRVFEHELIDHVRSCPMKYTCVTENTSSSVQMPSNVSMEQESEVTSDHEIWDEDLPDTSSNLDDDIFKHSFDSKSRVVIAKRYSNKLRRPFGYSESLMLETSSQNTDDDDVHSVTSDMGVGRGRSISGASSVHSIRGTNNSCRIGIRGIRDTMTNRIGPVQYPI